MYSVYLGKLKSNFQTVALTMYKQAKNGRLYVTLLSLPPHWEIHCRPLEQSLCKAPTYTSLPTCMGAITSLKLWSIHNYIQARGLFFSRLGGSLVFFKAEPCFGVTVISCLTQPQKCKAKRAKYTWLLSSTLALITIFLLHVNFRSFYFMGLLEGKSG